MQNPPPASYPPAQEGVHMVASPARSWRTPWWLWVLAPVILVAVVVLQRPEHLSAARLADLESGRAVEPPGVSPEIAISKVVIAYQGKPLLGTDFSAMMMQQLDPPPAMPGMPAPPVKFAQDHFRTAVLVGKLGKTDDARERLSKLGTTIDAASPLHDDIATAKAIFAAEPVEQKAKDELIARHGWFGKLLFDDGSAGTIAKAKVDGERMVGTVAVAMVVMVLMLMAGVVCIIILTGLLMSGKITAWPIPRDPPAGSPNSRALWLETVVMFLAGFLALKLGVSGLAALAHSGKIPLQMDHLVWVSLGGQWLLIGTLFWPRVRGLSRAQHRAEAGWHRGRGFIREVGAGLLAYLAMVPLYFVMAIVVAIGMLAYYAASGKSPPQIDNKVMELASGGLAELVVVFMLATIWAPLVEETIFRGALYRLLRPRAGMIVAGLLTAAVFAVLHGYLVPQLVLVGTLGFCFAIIREWRGSLIGCMTAHGVHNALVFSFVANIAPIMQG